MPRDSDRERHGPDDTAGGSSPTRERGVKSTRGGCLGAAHGQALRPSSVAWPQPALVELRVGRPLEAVAAVGEAPAAPGRRAAGLRRVAPQRLAGHPDNPDDASRPAALRVWELRRPREMSAPSSVCGWSASEEMARTPRPARGSAADACA